MDVSTYTEEFHKLSLRCGHATDEKGRVARYINGLQYSIQDEITILTRETMDKCFQVALRVEEKHKRKGD